MTNRKGISKKESAAARRRRIKLLRDRAAKIGLEKPADARETGSGGRRRSAKVISKGKASLVISGAEAVRKEVSRPKQFAPEPRIVTPRKREQPEESPPEKEEPVVISRLESKVRPGKERSSARTRRRSGRRNGAGRLPPDGGLRSRVSPRLSCCWPPSP